MAPQARYPCSGTGKAPGSGLPADPGEAGGGQPALTLGHEHRGGCLDPGAGSAVRIPLQLTGLRTRPLPHQPVGNRTEMPLATRPFPHPHSQHTHTTHSRPWTAPCPPEGPAPGRARQCTGIHPGPPGPCSQRAQDPSPPIRGPAPVRSKPASASGPASPSSRQTSALGTHSPADWPAGRHLSWDQLGPEFCPLTNENNKHNDLKTCRTQQEQQYELQEQKNLNLTLHLQN